MQHDRKSSTPNDRKSGKRTNDMLLETALLLVNNFASYAPGNGTLGYAEALPTERTRQAQRLVTA